MAEDFTDASGFAAVTAAKLIKPKLARLEILENRMKDAARAGAYQVECNCGGGVLNTADFDALVARGFTVTLLHDDQGQKCWSISWKPAQ